MQTAPKMGGRKASIRDVVVGPVGLEPTTKGL